MKITIHNVVNGAQACQAFLAANRAKKNGEKEGKKNSVFYYNKLLFVGFRVIRNKDSYEVHVENS